jgi:hypothetical protein
MFRCVYEEACPYCAPDWRTVVDHLASEHGITGDAEERQYVQFMPGTVSPWVAQWHLMAGVQVHIDYRVPAWDPSWPCAHCQTVLTLRTCTYAPNRVGSEGQPDYPGDLCCPHCGMSTARAYWRLCVEAGAPAIERDDTDDENDTAEP